MPGASLVVASTSDKRNGKPRVAEPQRKQGVMRLETSTRRSWRGGRAWRPTTRRRLYRARGSLRVDERAPAPSSRRRQLLVRGVAKVTCVALLAASASNLMPRAAALVSSPAPPLRGELWRGHPARRARVRRHLPRQPLGSTALQSVAQI
jgi:hypothetical protein